MFNLQKFLDTLFLEECLHCRKSGQLLCNNCLYSIRRKPKNSHQNSYTINLVSFTWVHSPLLFQNEILKKSIHLLKYSHTRSIAKYLARIVYQDFFIFLTSMVKDKEIEIKDIILLPIPISRNRLLERNYNQSEILLREILKLVTEREQVNLENNLVTDLLLKVKHTIRFTDTPSREMRQELIQDTFKVNSKYSAEFLEDKIFLIFDDVTTTGATFYEARKTLVESGAKFENIFAYALAH